MKNYILKIKTLLLLVLVSISIKAEVPSWLIGKWTDGNAIIEITSDSKMRIYENDILTKEGSFTYDHSGFIETKWDKDLKPEDEYFLCLNSNPNWLAHEGGDHLTKLPDNIEANNNDNQEKDYSGELNSNVFIKYSQRCWKNISWVYGEWKIPANHPSGKTYSVKITPFYYQETTEKTDSITDFSELSKKWYKVMEGEHNLFGNIIFIDDLYFDLGAKRICLSNLDKKIYLEQTVEYTTTTVKVVFWIIASIISLVILWGVFILSKIIIRIVKSSGKTIATWIKRLWNNIHSKTISIVKKSKDQWEESVKPIASSAINQIDEKIKTKASVTTDKVESSSINNNFVKKIIYIICAIIIIIFTIVSYTTDSSEEYSYEDDTEEVYDNSKNNDDSKDELDILRDEYLNLKRKAEDAMRRGNMNDYNYYKNQAEPIREEMWRRGYHIP